MSQFCELEIGVTVFILIHSGPNSFWFLTSSKCLEIQHSHSEYFKADKECSLLSGTTKPSEGTGTPSITFQTPVLAPLLFNISILLPNWSEPARPSESCSQSSLRQNCQHDTKHRNIGTLSELDALIINSSQILLKIGIKRKVRSQLLPNLCRKFMIQVSWALSKNQFSVI